VFGRIPDWNVSSAIRKQPTRPIYAWQTNTQASSLKEPYDSIGTHIPSDFSGIHASEDTREAAARQDGAALNRKPKAHRFPTLRREELLFTGVSGPNSPADGP
jgi:hypothetical protein